MLQALQSMPVKLHVALAQDIGGGHPLDPSVPPHHSASSIACFFFERLAHGVPNRRVERAPFFIILPVGRDRFIHGLAHRSFSKSLVVEFLSIARFATGRLLPDAETHFHHRRAIRRSVILIVLAVFSTVAVAWIIACITPTAGLGGRFVHDDGSFVWRTPRLHALGWRVENWALDSRWLPDADERRRTDFLKHLTANNPNDLFGRWRMLPSDAPQTNLSRMTELARTGADDRLSLQTFPDESQGVIIGTSGVEFAVDSFGLPFSGMWRVREIIGSSKNHRGSIEFPAFRPSFPVGSPNGEPARLPLFVHRVPFIANVGVFAAIWWVPLFGVPLAITALRTWRRSSRGCCSKCGYDLTGATHAKCPECGFSERDNRV